LCVAGTAKSGKGDADCDACSSGEYSRTGAVSCVPCEAGSISGQTSATGCDLCGAGKYSAAKASVCLNCHAGSFSPLNAGTCTACPANSYSPQNAQSRLSCVCKARYTGGVNGVFCSSCLAGTCKPSSGNGGCDSCVAVMVCEMPARISSNTCTDHQCNSGNYSSAETSTCLLCPANSDAPASSALISCNCNAGYTGSNSGTCTACTRGKSQPESGSAFCSDCPSGWTSDLAAINCAECPPGTYAFNSAWSRSASCIDCDAGKYWGKQANTGEDCSLCAAGKYSRTGAAECTPCADNSESKLARKMAEMDFSDG